MRYTFFILILTSLFFASCKETPKTSDKPFSNCKCGKPEPIFKDGGNEAIADRNFTMTKESAIETVVFKDGGELQVVQTGCNEIIQEFTFSYRQDLAQKDDEFWKAKAVEEFNKIAVLAPRYQPFGLWGRAIQAASAQLKLGEALELEKDFFVTVSKVFDGKNTLLIIKLNAKTC